jgi:hypothetical protein
MRTACLALALLFASAGARAAPPGVNLSWDDCGGAGALNRDFACDTNEGAHFVVGSLVAPAGVSQAVRGFEAIVYVSAGSTVPDWWQFINSGACRQTSATLGLDFGGMTSCSNLWLGEPTGALGLYQAVPGVGMQLGLVMALDQAEQGPLTEGVEYYLFRIAIDHANTVGPSACAGCTDTARVWLDQATIVLPLGHSDILVRDPSSRDFVLWQHGNVPVRSSTWGQLKQLYR